MLYNSTKKQELAAKVRLCQSIASKALGLMFSRPIKDFCLVFPFKCEQRVDLHMFFVFFPIDVLFLDSQKRVVETKENFRPFTYYSPKEKSRFVIELPVNTVKKTGTEIKDIISWD